MKTTSGLLKLLHPDGLVSDDELASIVELSCELRQRVREQLHLIAPGEYDRISLGAVLNPSGRQVVPTLPDSERVQRITLPERPAVGEVVGLAVDGDHGTILRFEMQATKGTGRIVSARIDPKSDAGEQLKQLPSTSRLTMRILGSAPEWRSGFDVAVLATFMGIPKEGPSRRDHNCHGHTLQLLRKYQSENDVALTGEITIMGRVLPVGGIQQKIRAAYERRRQGSHTPRR